MSQPRPEILLIRLQTDQQIGPQSTSRGLQEQYASIPSVNSLQSLKNNLSNVMVVGLIVAVFNKTIGFEVNNATDLLALCGSVAILALSAWLIVRSHGTGHD